MAKIPHIDPLDLIGAAPKLNKAQLKKIEERANTIFRRNVKSQEIQDITTPTAGFKEITWEEAYAQAMREFRESNK